MADENQKQTVSIVTTLSSQLMAAALAMIAVLGGFLTFALDKKDCGVWFWILVTAAFLAFVFSIILGGKGITKLYKTGAEGNWSYAGGDSKFQLQTGLCLIGLIVFGLAVVAAQKDKKPSDADEITAAIDKVTLSLDKQTLAIQELGEINQTNASTAQIVQLQQQIQMLQDKIDALAARSSNSPSFRRGGLMIGYEKLN